jgi:hypothetical protein
MTVTEPFYGRCDTCASKLGSRYHVFCRHVERLQYDAAGEGAAPSIFTHVLHAEHLTQYCGAACAEDGGYCQLYDRGIPFGMVADGPLAPCSKCRAPMDLTQAHVAYELMEQTETRQPWLTSIEPHDSQTIARLCKNCDADLSVDTAEEMADAAWPRQDTEQAVEMDLTFMRATG